MCSHNLHSQKPDLTTSFFFFTFWLLVQILEDFKYTFQGTFIICKLYFFTWIFWLLPIQFIFSAFSDLVLMVKPSSPCDIISFLLSETQSNRLACPRMPDAGAETIGFASHYNISGNVCLFFIILSDYKARIGRTRTYWMLILFSHLVNIHRECDF